MPARVPIVGALAIVKGLAGLTMLLFSGLLLACESESESESEAAELAVTGQGFYTDVSEPGAINVYYAVTFRNRNETQALISSQFEVRFLDAAGNEVGVDGRDLDVVLPGQEVAQAAQAPATSEPASMEVMPMPGEMREADGLSLLEPVAGTYEPYPDLGFSTVTATIENPYESDLPNLETVAVFYDSSGSVMGGWTLFSEEVPAGESVPISIEVVAQPPSEPASVLVFPALSLLSFPDVQSRQP